MPQDITDVDEFTSPCTAPADGDTRNATSVLTPLQKLANRTRWLYNKITNGVPRVQYFADLTSLKAVTGQVDGDVALALDGLGRMGIYRYDTAYSGAEVSPYYLKPTGFLDGTSGRWVHLFYNYGITESDDSLNRWTFNGPGRVVEALEAVVTSPSSNVYADSASWQDVGLSLTKTLVLGDIVQLAATAVWAVDVAEKLNFRIRVEAPGGNSALDGSQLELDPIGVGKKNLFHATGKWTATEAGSHVFKLQILVQAGGPYNATLYAQRALHGLWIRP